MTDTPPSPMPFVTVVPTATEVLNISMVLKKGIDYHLDQNPGRSAKARYLSLARTSCEECIHWLQDAFPDIKVDTKTLEFPSIVPPVSSPLQSIHFKRTPT